MPLLNYGVPNVKKNPIRKPRKSKDCARRQVYSAGAEAEQQAGPGDSPSSRRAIPPAGGHGVEGQIADPSWVGSGWPTKIGGLFMMPPLDRPVGPAGVLAARAAIAVLDGEPFGEAFAFDVTGVALVDQVAQLVDEDVVQV